MRIAFISLGQFPFTVFTQHEMHPHATMVGVYHRFMAMKIDCDYFLVRSHKELPKASELNKRYDGILLYLDSGISTDFLAHISIPCLAINLEQKATGISFVNFDGRDGIRQAISHLKERGFTRIGYVGFFVLTWAHERRAAFAEHMKALGLELHDQWICDHAAAERILGRTEARILERIWFKETWPAQTKLLARLFDELLSHEERPEAIVFANDLIARMFYLYAVKRGIQVPGDIAITGIDDFGYDFPPHGSSFLTTLRQDFNVIGDLAAKVLTEMVRKERPMQGQRILLPMRLVVRHSTARRAESASERADIDLKNVIIDYLDRHYHEENRLHYLAHMLGYSLSHLSGKFKRLFGVSFKQYLSDKRLEKAALYLRSTKQPVTSIAFDVGYTNHSSFSTLFLRKFGCSPSAYRARTFTTRRHVN